MSALPSKVGLGIADVGQIGGARARAEMAEQRIVPRIAPSAALTSASALVQVAEADGAGRAGGLAGGHDFAVADRAVLTFGGAARAADALNAIGAFLHHAARADRDLGIVLRLDRLPRRDWRIPGRRRSRRN